MTAPFTSPVAGRVGRHRLKMATEGCQRLEVTIGSDVVEKMRELAKRKGCSLWQVIEEACEAYAALPGTKEATENR